MRIGIDIDGCLTDIAKFIADYGIKFCYENGIEYKIKPEYYDEDEALGISAQNSEKFWNKYLPYYATQYPTREFASEVVNRLKQKNEIYIITARNDEGLPPEFHEEMKKMVKKWLADNKIEYDEIIFTKGSKLTYCIEKNIEIMIEDSPKNIKDISSKIPVLCFDNPYNKDVGENNITRVYSWYDILSKLT